MAFDPKKLRAMLDDKGISQPDLARRVGRNLRTVTRWLSGDTPNRNSLEKIADIFGCDSLVFDSSFTEKGEVGVNARVSTASHNAFALMQRRYGVSQDDIVELAPVLFAIVADLALGVPAQDEERARNGYVPYWNGSAERQEGFQLDRRAARDGKCFGLPPQRPDRQETRNLFFTALERLCADARNVVAMPWGEPSEVPTARGFNPDAAWLAEAAGGDLHLTHAVTTGRVRLSAVLEEHARGAVPIADLLRREVQKSRNESLRRLADWQARYREQHPDEAGEYDAIIAAHCHPDGCYPDHYSDDFRAECRADPFREDRHIDVATLPAYQAARKAAPPGSFVFPDDDPVCRRFEHLEAHRAASKRVWEAGR